MESKSMEGKFETITKKKRSNKKTGCENKQIYKYPCCRDCGRRSGVMGGEGFKKYNNYKNACKFNYRNGQNKLITANVGDPDNTRFLRKKRCREIPGAKLTESQKIGLAKVLGRCAAEREIFTAECIHDNCEYEERYPGGHVNRIQDLREVENICENSSITSRRAHGYRRKRSRRKRKRRKRKSRKRKS